MRYTYVESPLGPLLLAGSGTALELIGLPEGRGLVTPAHGWRRDDSAFAVAALELREYFDGLRRTFSLEVAPAGTPFQQRVWRALTDIPFGTTISYGTLAARVGRPSAARAVGLANGRNPLPIVVPCHRVIGSDGSLTGYGGGLEAKRFLLELERRVGGRDSGIGSRESGQGHLFTS